MKTRKNKEDKTMSTEPTPQPNVVNLDAQALMGMLATLLQSQSENAKINQKLLDIELAKQEATINKETKALAQLERARSQAHSELKRKRENEQRRYDSCPHTDQKQGSTIYPISNNPDHQLRGVCTQCTMPIEPAHYEEDAYGKKTLVPEHPLYKLVLQRDAALYGQQVFATSY